jgi:hypothetical protein
VRNNRKREEEDLYKQYFGSEELELESNKKQNDIKHVKFSNSVIINSGN